MNIWSLAAFLSLSIFVFGCSAPQAQPTGPAQAPSQPKPGGTLYLAHGTDPPDLDALWSTSVATLYLTAPAYNGLVKVDPRDNRKVIPDLAEKWELSSDGKIYTFHLNKKAKWHDGQPVTARDAKFFFDVRTKPPLGICCPEGKSSHKLFDDLLEGIEAVDDATIKIKLKQPSQSFLLEQAGGRALVVPYHIASQKRLMENNVLGSGPFKFVSYTRGTSFKLTKNPDYFKPGLPYLDNIEIFILPDSSSRAAAFRAGRIDVTSGAYFSPSSSQAATIEREMKDSAKVEYGDALDNVSIQFNFARPPFNDPRVRLAAHLAVDRQRAIKTLVEGYGEIGTNLPRVKGLTRFGKELENTPGYRQPKDQDIAEAKRLLDEAGYKVGPDGKRMSIRAITRGDPGFEAYVDATVFFKDEMARLGIDVTVEPLQAAVSTSRLRAGDWEAAPRTRVAFWASAISNRNYWEGQDVYGAFPRNQERDKALNDVEVNLDPSKEKELVRRLEDLLEKELIYSFWYWRDYPIAIMNYVQDFKPAIGIYANHQWEAVWLNK